MKIRIFNDGDEPQPIYAGEGDRYAPAAMFVVFPGATAEFDFDKEFHISRALHSFKEVRA